MHAAENHKFHLQQPRPSGKLRRFTCPWNRRLYVVDEQFLAASDVDHPVIQSQGIWGMAVRQGFRTN